MLLYSLLCLMLFCILRVFVVQHTIFNIAVSRYPMLLLAAYTGSNWILITYQITLL